MSSYVIIERTGPLAIVKEDEATGLAVVYMSDDSAEGSRYAIAAASSASASDGYRQRAFNTVPFASWTALAAATGMIAGDLARVRASDTGTHTSLAGDFGASGGNTPNAGDFTYTIGVGWVRSADLDSQTALGFVAAATDVAMRLPAPLQILTTFNGTYSHYFVSANLFTLAKINAATGEWTLALAAESIIPPPSQLAGVIFKDIGTFSGWLCPVLDASNNIIGGFKSDGKFLATLDASVVIPPIQPSGFAQNTARQILPYATDVVPVPPDMWRGTVGGLPIRTAADGTAWARLGSNVTNNVRGANGSGTTLQFRRSSRLPIKGGRYCGTFAPAISAVNYRTTFTTALPSTSGAATGDYWIFSNTTTQTFGSDTYIIGDLAVWNGSALVRQPGPTPLGGSAYTNRIAGDWWAVTAAFSFDGVSYAIGDRIVYIGNEAGFTLGIARWAKGDYAGRGELFYRGEFDASGGSMPASPVNGELYQVSVAGTAGGITWAVSDYAVYESGAWGRIATDTITSVGSAAYVSLTCFGNSAEWEVRRADKSATRAVTQLNVRTQSMPRRALDDVALYSDSLFGTSTVGTKILSALGRNGIVKSFPTASSDNVLEMLQFEIARLGDRYKGNLHLFWHGQNNQPTSIGSGNWAQVTSAALAMRELVGARDGRLMFLSIMGTRTFTWSGTRLVCAQLEDQFNATGTLYALEQWYAQMFPGQWISPRQVLLAAAATSAVPDLSYPGMTEAQIAATYGILPLRYYYGWQSLPASVQANPASANYTGTWATAGLPSGGTAGDYMIRTANGTVGSLIFNVAGTWTEPSFDSTHLSEIGAQALANGVAATIVTNNF